MLANKKAMKPILEFLKSTKVGKKKRQENKIKNGNRKMIS